MKTKQSGNFRIFKISFKCHQSNFFTQHQQPDLGAGPHGYLCQATFVGCFEDSTFPIESNAHGMIWHYLVLYPRGPFFDLGFGRG